VTISDTSRAEKTYQWTIRALYAIGLAGNLWILYVMVKDEPETQEVFEILRSKWERFSASLSSNIRRIIPPTEAEVSQLIEAAEFIVTQEG